MRSLAAVLLSLVLTLAVAEVVVRVWNPDPRTQVVLDDTPGLEVGELFGEPVWRRRNPMWRALSDRDCRGEVGDRGRVILLVGDSILHTTGTHNISDNLGPKLEAALGGPEAGWCVVNAAMSGFSAQQKYVTMADGLRRQSPDLVLWEVWGEGPTYRRIGEGLYAVGGQVLDAGGVPLPFGLPLPSAINHALFTRSRLWSYAALALAPRRPEDLTAWHARAIADARAAGAQLVFAVFPALDRPFDAPAGEGHAVHPALRALADSEGVPMLDIRPRLVDQDVTAIRLDPCCHYNAEGHTVVAEVLEEIVREVLPPPGPPH